jgi:hypothetical protein
VLINLSVSVLGIVNKREIPVGSLLGKQEVERALDGHEGKVVEPWNNTAEKKSLIHEWSLL